MWYLRAMRHYVDFNGRARRIEFWEFVGGWIVLGVVAAVIDGRMADYYGWTGKPVELAVTLIHLVPFFAVAVRRSHDLDRTGWLSPLGLVPFVGFAMLVLWAFPGTSGPNRFGPEPEIGADGRSSFLGSRTRTMEAWEPRIDPVAIVAPHPAGELTSPWPDPLATVAEIERLADLLYGGALTDAEFEGLKERLIAREQAQ